ncbi:MAG: type II toxin-antitoxin system CcdA family antitoxin [Pseudomonadota bacterium]
MTKTSSEKRRRINLSIREDIIDAAKALSLNASRAAEAGIAAAVQKAQEAQWLEENRSALDAHNRRVEEQGVLLTPDWATED